MVKRRTAVVTCLGVFLLVTSAAAAVSQSGIWSDMPEVTAGGRGLLVDAPRTVAAVALVRGGSIDFVDVGGGVGMGERSPRSLRPVTVALIVRYRATPLEIFSAAAPRGTIPPAALRLDHYRYQRRSGWPPAAPRDLSLELATLNLDDPGVEPFACDGMGHNWNGGWADTFAGVTDYEASTFKHQYVPNPYYTFYPGGYYNQDNTITPGYNSITYLGACNGDENTPFTLQIHRRINYGTTPDGPTWIWTDVDDVILSDQEKYTFHSNVPGSYRGRVTADETIGHFGAGVAYTKYVPIGVGS
jgi:hypothetical protein